MRINIQKILCTTDFSPFSNFAVSYSLALTREFEAKLSICHVIDLTTAGMYGEAFWAFEEQQERIRERALRELEEFIGPQSVDWEPLITSGHPADEITRLSQENAVDLVVSATHGRSGLKRFIIGSVTGRLMRTLPCPLLVVQSKEEALKPPLGGELRMKRILVGCDFSDDSGLAFQYGVSLAQEFQAELHLVHVIEPSAYRDLVKPNSSSIEELRETIRASLSEKLENMLPEEAFSWCTVKTALLSGQPHQELIEYAQLNEMDLIVLGIRGHSMVESLIIGSTTDRVTSRSPAPVLCVRAMGKNRS
ncbi:MAG: universal stress protein [Desulfatiglandales bacterium]